MEKGKLQLVIRHENLELPSEFKDSLVHQGLGHVVLDVNDKEEMLKFVTKAGISQYFFRLSFEEHIKEVTNTSRCYLIPSGNFFKPRISKDKTILYFLGVEFLIIELKTLGSSTKYDIDQYHCNIFKLNVDPKTGDIVKEDMWESTKFGKIEKYLPNKFSQFKDAIIQCRKRLNTVEAKKSR